MMKKTCVAAFAFLIQTLHCSAFDDSPFQLTNSGLCLVTINNACNDIRWTTGDRLVVQQRNKCLGVQGKSVGSEISLYHCDENSELQKWECKNGTVLALKGQELYIEVTADNTAVLSGTIGPNNHLTIPGTSSGACSRTYRELYSIGGNAAGMPCMFPFLYRDQWHSDCTTLDSSERRLWCAVETHFQSERWGYCPITSKEGWTIHPTTGAYYQLNTQSALTWPQAEASCKQQGASLLSITDPHQQAYVTALLGAKGIKLWTGLVLNPEHGWKWSNGRPYRYMKWDSGHPLPNPGHSCAIVDPAVQYSWQSSPCSKKLGYICYSEVAVEQPTQAAEAGFCSRPWIPYNGHCFSLSRTPKTWSDAQRECRSSGGDLVSIRNVEDQSFVISLLGYAPTDELWIGLNDRRIEGLFDWIDHTTVSFTSWEFGKPDASSEIKDCVLIRGENGNWADRVCQEKHGYICMNPSKSTGHEVELDEGCRTGWRRYGSYCYFASTEAKTFDEARDDCKRTDSYLADVSNGLDNAFLIILVGQRPEKHFWLGLSNQRHHNQFVWTNKDSVTFTHWNADVRVYLKGCVAMTTGISTGLWDLLPCTNKETYICKHLAEGAALTVAPPIHIPLKCADNWILIESRNLCVQHFGGYVSGWTWYEARDYCRAVGGDLLSVHSAADLQALYRFRNVWIGLSAPDPATGYEWNDGSPLQFEHWEDGQPDNKNNVESCVELKSNGYWNDLHCESFRGMICQIPIDVTPILILPDSVRVTPDYNRTSDGWIEWRGNQYYMNERSMAMEDARRYCKKKNGDLVTINSEAESVFLWKRISRVNTYLWIGLTIDLNGTYGWMDGSPLVFQRWDQNQPRFLNDDENCAVMTNSMGFWHDCNCGFEHGSICKRSGSPPARATVPPTATPKGGCPQNWTKMDSKCYNVINDKNETWEGARTQCRAMGGNLVSIISRHVQVFLTNALIEAPTTDLWIGLNSVNRDPFYWTDGRPMKYYKWGSEHQSGRYNRRYSYYHNNERDEVPLTRYKQECAVMTTDRKVGVGEWIKKPCNETTGYICHRNVDRSLPDSPEPTATDYVKILNDSIKVITQPMNWNAAKKHCEADGAQLASLRNEWSNVYTQLMALNFKAPLWIGLNKMKTGGYFRFIDGWHLTMAAWGRQEPWDAPCVYMDVNGEWRTADCSENKMSICMKSTDVPPTEPSNFPGFCPEYLDTSRYTRQRNNWIPFRGYCYLFFTEQDEWPRASANCIKYGGSLASIEDPSEQSFIESNLKVYQDSSFWIGLYKTYAGLWRWLDKTTMDYSNWDEGQPYSDSYAAIQKADGKWTASFNQRKAYICKTAKVRLEVSPTTEKSTVDSLTHDHYIWLVVVVIAVIVVGAVILLFVCKKSGRCSCLPGNLTMVDNPISNNELSRPNQANNNTPAANGEEESTVCVTLIPAD